MLTNQKQTEIRIKADELAAKLFDQVTHTAVSLDAQTVQVRMEVEEFFRQQVVAALGQKVTRLNVDNELLCRDASK